MYELKNAKLESVEKLKMKNEDGTPDLNSALYRMIFQQPVGEGFTEKHLFYVNKPEVNYVDLVGKNFNVWFNIAFSQEAKIRGKKAVIVETEKVKFARAELVA